MTDRDLIAIEIKKLRADLGLTQERFSEEFGFDLSTLRNWEQGRYGPGKAERILLGIVAEEPNVVRNAVQRLSG